MKTNNYTYLIKPRTQKGIVLPIALILLLVSTLIGVTSLRSNTLSEKMTRNTLQRQVAFDRAESALLIGENIVLGNAITISDAIINAASSNNCDTSITYTLDGTDATSKGFCSPSNHPQGGGAITNVERWKTPGIWTNANNRYIEIDANTKLIIEFVGHIFAENNVSSCTSTTPPITTPPTTWPYCLTDGRQFRITAHATGDGDQEARVMLQSTYVVAPAP